MKSVKFAVALFTAVLLMTTSALAEESDTMQSLAEEAEYEQTMNFREILDFIDTVRPGWDFVSIKEWDNYYIIFQVEEYAAMILGEDGQYPREVVLLAIQSAPEVFGERWYTAYGFEHALKYEYGIQNATVELVDETTCKVVIGEKEYNLPMVEKPRGMYISEIELYKIIWDQEGYLTFEATEAETE